MDEVERLLKGTVSELEKLLNAKNVLGDPIERGNSTVIPIVSYGFAFGAGGGNSDKTGTGGGTGGGGGIKPVGAVILDEDGARVEGIHGATSEMINVLSKAAAKAIDKAADLAGAGKKDGKDKAE